MKFIRKTSLAESSLLKQGIATDVAHEYSEYWKQS